MRILRRWQRWQVAGAVAVVLVLVGTAVLAGSDEAEPTVQVGATADATTTTTPPEVLGDVIVRDRTVDVAPTAAGGTTTAPAPVETTAPAATAAPATTAPPAAPGPVATARPAPGPAPATPTTVAPEPVTIEVRRAPDSPELSVVLTRDGTVVGSGTVRDTLRFEGLTAGVHVLEVGWESGVVVDEETGTSTSASGLARYEVAAEPVVTVVTCSPDGCEVA